MAVSAKVRAKGSLVIVGSGIKVGAHATVESVEHIRQAEKLFYLVTELATAVWLKRLNPTAETLDDLYAEGMSRRVSYHRMTKRILAAVRSGQQVCVVFYGHPGVFANAAHRAIGLARRSGFSAEMLPGVSAEDCLFADLGVNPGDHGCQTFEATDFLAARRIFDPTSALILYQVGALGEGSVRLGMVARPDRVQTLANRLRRFYPRRHPVVLYEASSFPLCGPMILKTSMEKFSSAEVRPMTTIYVPPRKQRAPDPNITKWYEVP